VSQLLVDSHVLRLACRATIATCVHQSRAAPFLPVDSDGDRNRLIRRPDPVLIGEEATSHSNRDAAGSVAGATAMVGKRVTSSGSPF